MPSTHRHFAYLAEDNFNLEGRIMGELKQMEEESARINSQIEEVRGGAGGGWRDVNRGAARRLNQKRSACSVGRSGAGGRFRVLRTTC